MRASKLFVVALGSLGVLVAAVSYAAPTVGTAPPLGTVPPPTMAPQIVGFKRFVQPGVPTAQFYSGGAITYAVEVKNTTSSALQKTVTLKPANGAFVIASGVANVAAGQTGTVQLTDANGIDSSCAPTDYLIELESYGSRKAQTTPSCTFQVAVSDPWASLSPGERQAKEQGHAFVFDAKAETGVCKGAWKMSLQAKNNTKDPVQLGFMWIHPSASDRLTVGPGATRTFSWETKPFFGQAGSYHVALSPYATGGPPAGVFSPRPYEAKVTRSCTLAIALVN